MFSRLAHFIRQGVLVVASLAIVFVGVVAAANAHPSNQDHQSLFFEAHKLNETMDSEHHARHQRAGFDHRSDHHPDHSGDCHTGVCCVMDCQHVADKQGGPAELIASAGMFSIVDLGSRYPMIPDRPPRHS